MLRGVDNYLVHQQLFLIWKLFFSRVKIPH